MVATIGFFDGVHLGHRFLIRQVMEEALRRHMQSLLVTFGEHPMKVIRSDFQPQLITTHEEKLGLLSSSGVDSVAVLDFTREQSMLTAREFMEQVLLNTYNVRVLLIGYDHRFGHNREEEFDDYVRYGKEIGIEVVQSDSYRLAASENVVPSSTSIRKALLGCDIRLANTLLGYSYFMQGNVVGGFQNGRKLGYPTANLSIADEKLVPGSGVYLVRVGQSHFGMLNIGTRPTLGNGSQRSIEVNIFDFHDDIYSQSLRIEFLSFIRNEQKFDSIEQLQSQLHQDELVCRELIEKGFRY